jgi:hypothetical protein
VELGGYYGLTYPEDSGPGRNTSFSYMEIDNDFVNPLYRTHGLAALQVTLAHEFYHAIQFGYYDGRDGSWWQEASATWMEEVAYPEVDDYVQYLDEFMLHPERAFDRGSPFDGDTHVYGAALFAHYLDQRFNRDLIRSTWEEFDRQERGAVELFDGVIPGGLGQAVSEFAVWNYFTGLRHRPGRFYREGDKCPEVSALALATPAKVAVMDSGQVDHLGSVYLQLAPAVRSGGVVLRPLLQPGSWRPQLILTAPDSVELRRLQEPEDQVQGWDQYEEVVLVLTVTTAFGSGYEYAVAAEYDPELTREPVPLAFNLGQNYPNPFRIGAHGSTTIPFVLNRPSPVTRLSIFTADGQRVWQYDLGPRAARAYQRDQWDGRNEAGKPVSPGVYYYVLEAHGEVTRGTMAVVAE